MQKLFCALMFLTISGCALNANDPVATYRPVDGRYEVKLTGRRGNMAHDPISAIFRGSSPSTVAFSVPRVLGKVRGEEIPIEKGDYAYLGEIDFNEDSILVDLFYNNTDDRKIEATRWNGRYMLKKAP